MEETNAKVIEPEDQSKPFNGAIDMDSVKTNIDFLLDIPVEISVQLGRTRKKINELLQVAQGSVVEFPQLEGERVDLFVNKTLIARGVIVVEKEKYSVHVTETINRMERIHSLQ